MKRNVVLWLLVSGCGGCGGASGEDAGTRDADGADSMLMDGSLGGAVDAAVDGPSADGSIDGELDGMVDAGPRRLMGPGDEEPPETDLEPGSDADHAYRYCWHLSQIICDGAFDCCEVAAETIFTNDYEQCLLGFRESACRVYSEWPDSFGPFDVEELESNLAELAESVVECREPMTKFGFIRGNVDEGGACTDEQPEIGCRDGLYCTDETCRAFSVAGESCAGQLQCDNPESAYCSEDVCVAWGEGELDEPCTSDHDCASRRCTDEACDTEPFTWCLGAD